MLRFLMGPSANNLSTRTTFTFKTFFTLSLTVAGAGLGVLFFPAKLIAMNFDESPLLLKAEEQQIQLLNQKLEYHVQNNKAILIGNLKVSPKNLSVKINNKGTATLVAPLQFMVGGKLILKDPHGRALWSVNIDDPSQLVIEETKDSDEDIDENKPPQTLAKAQGERETSARYEFDIDRSLEKKLRQLAFFNFCTFIETESNRMQACTPSVSLAPNDETWTLKPLKSNEGENVILVNGVEVNEHGIIQFDKNVKTVSLAATLVSGLSVEVRTEFIPLDVYNLTQTKDSQSVALTLKERFKKNRRTYSWTTQISPSAPSLFIEALGQVPLKQEVSLVQEKIPTELTLPEIVVGHRRTYNASTTLLLNNEDDLKLRVKTKGDELTELDANEYRWTLNNLKYGYNSPHSLSLENNKWKGIALFEVERQKPWMLSLQIGGFIQQTLNGESLSSSNTSPLMAVSLERYFDGLMGMKGPSHFLRWGLMLDWLSVPSKDNPQTFTEIGFSYRLTSSYHHSESSSSLKVSALTLTTQTAANQLMGLRWIHDGPSSLAPTLFGDQHVFKLGYFTGANSTTKDPLSYSDVQWESRYLSESQSYWSWQLRFNQIALKPKDIDPSTLQNIEFYFGWGSPF